MQKRQIINIVNFIRGCEPRCEVDLVEPVRNQLALLDKYGFRGSFLFQYDALIDSAFTGLFGAKERERHEIGVWLEIVEPMARATGIPWRGRFPWDWHANVGFSVGYTPKEREILADILFEKFKEVFGYYPRTVGSWIIDAHTLAYLSDKYGLDASCNCKDQWGTDGYTLWGAYYNQAYYPSKANVFSPAQSERMQIPVPVFRMLGSDPVEQYDCGLDPASGAPSVQGVITLEPVYSGSLGGGGEEDWVKWYLGENFSGNCLSFGYTQAGQENSFGWQAMRDGLETQLKYFDRMVKDGAAEVETLGESGRWFKRTFEKTPASSVAALSHWKEDGKRSVWYDCRNYRVNIYSDPEGIRIRDLYIFREDYPERYLNDICRTEFLKFDNLPFVDGNRFSGGGILAGIRLIYNGTPVKALRVTYREEGEKCVCVDFMTSEFGGVTYRADPRGVTVTAGKNRGSLCLKYAFDKSDRMPSITVSDGALELTYRGYSYRVGVSGEARIEDNSICFFPDEKGEIAFYTDL